MFSVKKDGTLKDVPLIGKGFNNFIDHLFWYLPFSSVKQAHAVLNGVEEITIGDWDTKRAEIEAEHKLERARQELIDGWKAWIDENGPNRSGKSSNGTRPAGGILARQRD